MPTSVFPGRRGPSGRKLGVLLPPPQARPGCKLPWLTSSAPRGREWPRRANQTSRGTEFSCWMVQGGPVGRWFCPTGSVEPLIGRDTDVEFLCSFVEQSAAQGGAFLLSGDAGVGPSSWTSRAGAACLCRWVCAGQPAAGAARHGGQDLQALAAEGPPPGPERSGPAPMASRSAAPVSRLAGSNVMVRTGRPDGWWKRMTPTGGSSSRWMTPAVCSRPVPVQRRSLRHANKAPLLAGSMAQVPGGSGGDRSVVVTPGSLCSRPAIMTAPEISNSDGLGFGPIPGGAKECGRSGCLVVRTQMASPHLAALVLRPSGEGRDHRPGPDGQGVRDRARPQSKTRPCSRWLRT